MKRTNFPAFVSIAMLLAMLAFYLFNHDFGQWTNEAYHVFGTGDLSKIKKFLQPYRDIGYIIILGVFLFQLFLFFVPSVLVMSLSIMMYGPWIGGLLCLLGVFMASVFAYVLGEMLGDYTIDRIIGHSQRKKMTNFLQKYGFWTVAVFRLSPFLSNDAVSFVAGLVSMRFWRFIAATMVGITPLTILLAWMGENNGRLKIGFSILGGISVLALGMYIFIDKRKESRE